MTEQSNAVKKCHHCGANLRGYMARQRFCDKVCRYASHHNISRTAAYHRLLTNATRERSDEDEAMAARRQFAYLDYLSEENDNED